MGVTEELDDRSPLRVEVLRERLVAQHRWAAVDVVDSTGSTNTDLAEAARRGAADRTVLLAEEQTAGRGRQRRTWSSPRGAGLYLSVLLRPAGVPLSRWSWAPLLAGDWASWAGVLPTEPNRTPTWSMGHWV